MNTNEIINIVKKVQVCKSDHQRCLKRLHQIFNGMDQEQFLRVMFGYLRGVVFYLQHEYTGRIIEFFAKFVVLITSKRESENPDDPDTSFIRRVVDLTLETLTRSIRDNFRYNSCLLLRLILHNIHEGSSFDSDLFDKIQGALLERAYDKSHSIQFQALLALQKLQTPKNLNCPIIRAYSVLVSTDKNVAIRAEIIKMIAPTPPAISLIIKRTRDVSGIVQKAAFIRCADLTPKRFIIQDRQFILKSGLACDSSVKKSFNRLLVTWFNFYERDFIKFFHAIILDATEDDFNNWVDICSKVFKTLTKHIPVEDLISALPLRDKLIPLDEITERVETILSWLLTIKLLKTSNLLDDWDVVLPDLAPFCDYIERITQLKNQHIREGKWETLEYSQILYQLLEILEFCDISEEVGRQKLHSLILSQIKEEAGDIRTLRKLISLLLKLIPQKEDLINAVKGIISELYEVYVGSDVAPTPIDDVGVKIIQTQIWTAQMQLDDALEAGEYLQAEELKKKLNDAKERLNKLNVVVESPVMLESERNTVAVNFLNVFIALMELPLIDTITGTIQSIFDLVILPVSDNDNKEVKWRFLKSLGLICVLDEGVAKKYTEVLLQPLSNYFNGNFQKDGLITSLEMACDLYHCYNTKVFSIEAKIAQNLTKRKLYSNSDGDLEDMGVPKFYFEGVILIIMDIIDDEDESISKAALLSLHRMIMDKLTINPEFFSRLLLKWYNPTTDSSIRQLLSFMILSYLNHVKTGKEVMVQSICSVLRKISSAGMESPLAEIDVDDLLKFFATLTRSEEQINNYHLSISEIALADIRKEQGCGLYIQHLTKLLVFLKIPKEDVSVIRRLIDQVDSLMEHVALTKIEVTNLVRFKRAIMEDIVLNDEADNTQCINGDQNGIEARPSLENVPSSENANENENHSLHPNQASLPAGAIDNTNQSHQLPQGNSAVDGIQNSPNRTLKVILDKLNCGMSRHNLTLDNKSTGNKSRATRKAKSFSTTPKETLPIRFASSREITIESDSVYQKKKTTRRSIQNRTSSLKRKINQIDTYSSESDSESQSRRLTRNSFINRSMPGPSKNGGQTIRLPVSNTVNEDIPGGKNTRTIQSTQSSTVSPANSRKRQFGQASQILSSVDESNGEKTLRNKRTVHQLLRSPSSDESSSSKKRKTTLENQMSSSSNEIISASEPEYPYRVLTRQSSQSSSSGQNHGKKNGQTSQTSSGEAISGLELASQNKISTRQSSQSSSSDKSGPKHGKKNGQTSQTSSGEVSSGLELTSQNKISTRQSSQSSSSDKSGPKHGKKNGQTSQTSSGEVSSGLELASQNKISTRQSSQSSSSDRSDQNRGKKNGQTSQTSSGEVISGLELASQNKISTRQSSQSSSSDKNGPKHGKKNGQTSQTSSGEVSSGLELASQNKISTRQSSQSSSSDKNGPKHGKKNGQTSQTSSSEVTSGLELTSQNKILSLQSSQSSSSYKSCQQHGKKNGQTSSSEVISEFETASQNNMLTRQASGSSSISHNSSIIQSQNRKKNTGQTIQTSPSTNANPSNSGSHNKKTTSQSVDSSLGSSRSTRSKTSQSVESSLGSGRSTRSQRGNHEKGNGQTTQTSLSTNASASDSGSHNKKTSQSVDSSLGSGRSTRSKTSQYVESSLGSGRSTRSKTSQSVASSLGSGSSTRSQRGNHGQTTQTSLSTNASASDSGSHNKKTTYQSLQGPSGSGRSTRSRTGQTSSSTNSNVSDPQTPSQNSSESRRSTTLSQTIIPKRSLHSHQATSLNESESEIPKKYNTSQTNASSSNRARRLFPRESSMELSIENHPTNKRAQSQQSPSSSVENDDRNAKKVWQRRQISSSSSEEDNDGNLSKKLRELNYTSLSNNNGDVRRSTRKRRKNPNASRDYSSFILSPSPSRKKRKTATYLVMKKRLR